MYQSGYCHIKVFGTLVNHKLQSFAMIHANVGERGIVAML